jgi:hypothetical protein
MPCPPKERRLATAAVLIAAIVTARVPLVLRAADDIAADCSKTGADCRAFKGPATLIADDAACRCAAERANCGACAGVRAACAGSECECRTYCDD